MSMDTQNQAWSKDKSNFGFRMLQKMGWAEGKGLGANEDGTATHVRVKRRRENLALGAETVVDHTGNSTLTVAVDSFNSILASLKPVGATATTHRRDTGSENCRSRDKVAKGSGTRDAKAALSSASAARFHKILRNKDVSRYSAADMSAILGHAPPTSTQQSQRVTRSRTNSIAEDASHDNTGSVQDSDVQSAAVKRRPMSINVGDDKNTNNDEESSALTKAERRARREARKAARASARVVAHDSDQ